MLLLAITSAGLASIRWEAVNQEYELPTAYDPVTITWNQEVIDERPNLDVELGSVYQEPVDAIPDPVLLGPAEEVDGPENSGLHDVPRGDQGNMGQDRSDSQGNDISDQLVSNNISSIGQLGEGASGDAECCWIATHYGESYNGQRMGCADAGVYSSADPTILAVGPARYAEFHCGTRLSVCAMSPLLGQDGGGGRVGGAGEAPLPMRCLVVVRQDSCPGCGPNHLDLSEAGIIALGCSALPCRLDGLRVERLD